MMQPPTSETRMRLKISEAAMHVEVDVDDQDSHWACGI